MSKWGFFAYGSEPPHCGEFIEDAIKKVNKDGQLVMIKSWKLLTISGNLLISQILKEIESSDFFCADVTGLNENVLFELGFAIAKRKKIFITQDTSIIDSYHRFKELNFLTTVGYTNYTKSDDITNSFLREKPYEKEEYLLDQLFSSQEIEKDRYSLLYLKSQFDTNYNQYIINTIKGYKLPCIIDDSVEAKVQSLSWYISKLQSVPAVLIEFSSTYRSGYQLHNAKCAFVAGLALGLGLRVQMIAEKPYPTSIDYQEYLKKYTNLELCKAAISPFLTDLKANIAELISVTKTPSVKKRIESPLQSLKFGEYIAEHESSIVYDYYVDTAHKENIIKSEYNLVVGRKGTGKTATLYYLESAVSKDVRNLVVTIKPVNFEIDGLVELIKKLNSEFEKGYIIQSIWKFLIYTEVAKEIYYFVKNKPSYSLTELDNNIIKFVEENEKIILTDFSTRLEQELLHLQILQEINEQTEFREKLSQILHEKIIGRLKELIIDFMLKRNRLAILIDNLDKNWKKGKDIEVISKFILGLLGVIGRITKELKGNPKNPYDFDLNLVVFIRSDIFKHVLQFAREPDKIEYTKLRWDDSEVLFRIVEKRVEYFSDEKISSEAFWDKFIVKSVDGIDVKEYVTSCIIPRPRDLIYFLNSAKNIAISRGHSIIQSSDLEFAYTDYSNWVFNSVLVENGVTIQQMETFFYNCMGEASIMDLDQLKLLMKSIGIDIGNEAIVNKFIDHLCSMSFIGRETRPSHFSYDYDFDNIEKIKVLASKLGVQRFKVHNAFVPYLECSDYVK